MFSRRAFTETVTYGYKLWNAQTAVNCSNGLVRLNYTHFNRLLVNVPIHINSAQNISCIYISNKHRLSAIYINFQG